jgi:arylsulfatase
MEWNTIKVEKNKHKYPNIILIVIDALRAGNLGCYGEERDSSPNIDKIADKGVLFEDVYCSWNTTDQSLTTILSGRYPRTHGIIHHGDRVEPEDLNTFKSLNVRLLPQILKENGYETIAVDWMGRWFEKGFDYYGYKLQRNFLQKLLYYAVTVPYLHIRYIATNIGLLRIYAKKRRFNIRSLWKGFKDVLQTFRFSFELARVQDAAFVTGLAEQLIKKVKREKFFLFLHYWDTHSPYYCPRKFLSKKKPLSTKDALLSRYRGAVRHADQQIGRLLEILKYERLIENTLVIVTSDHGESLTEHDIFFDHHGLYDVTTHVPLIFYYPNAFSKSKRVKGLVGHIDLVPTLCELLNILPERYSFDGMDLMPLIRGEKKQIRDYVFNEESYVQRKIGLRTEKFKYIFAPDGRGMCNYCERVHGGKEELYDLEQDTEEMDNIADRDRLTAERMRNEVEDFIKNLNTKRQKELINERLSRLREEGELQDHKLPNREFSDVKNEREKKMSQRKEKITIELSEEIMKEIKRRIENTEFQSREEYLSYIIHEVFKKGISGDERDSKEGKRIKRKLRSLGYMD